MAARKRRGFFPSMHGGDVFSASRTKPLTHIMYPVVVDAKAFRDATGFQHGHDEIETIASFRNAFPRPA